MTILQSVIKVCTVQAVLITSAIDILLRIEFLLLITILSAP